VTTDREDLLSQQRPKDEAPPAPRDAATVILLRDDANHGPEVFMVRRHGKSAFMGGAFVFPGGKLDDADVDPSLVARARGVDPDGARAALAEPDLADRALGLYIAALRETFEEAGVLFAEIHGALSAMEARAALHRRESIVDVVRALDATLHLDALTPWTRWVTPVVEPRRYDTRFFLALTPAEQVATHDELETTEEAWMTPREALRRQDAGEVLLPPPTLRSLEMLTVYDRASDAIADARTRPPPLVEPVFLDDDGRLTLVLPGDPAHPVAEARIPGSSRFVLEDGRWWSARGASSER
jgi:8-oxo-dGTP pyrophosphatase MutT (NUDIX family)